MDISILQTKLSELLNTIKKDAGLSEELRDSLSDMIMATSAEPTPENLQALSLVLKKAGSTQSYMGAMTELQNLQLDAAMGL